MRMEGTGSLLSSVDEDRIVFNFSNLITLIATQLLSRDSKG